MPSAKDRARELGGGCFIKRNFTTKLPRTTLGAGLARTGMYVCRKRRTARLGLDTNAVWVDAGRVPTGPKRK